MHMLHPKRLERRSLRRLWSSYVGLAIATASIAAGCNTLPNQINGMIAKRLPAMLGPADRYDVHTSGSIFDLARGKLEDARIHGDNVALTPLLRVHSFDAYATDIHANPRTDTITGIGRTTFHLVMDQNDLNRYMLAARPDDYKRGARIMLHTSTILYSDSISILGLKTPFSVTGTLAPIVSNETELDFVPSEGAFARLRVPLPLLKAAITRQNPVVNLSQMTYPVTISSTRIVNATLVVVGSADLSSLVGKNSAAALLPLQRS